MEMRPLGSTGLRVSLLGLGTVKLGRTEGLKHPPRGTLRLPSDDEATALLDGAADLGITLLDTAPAYGVSEERLGELLSRGAGGGRGRWTIITKAGEEFEGGVSRFDFSPAAIRASVERSLIRLRTAHLEGVLLHSDGRDEWIANESGALDALAVLAREGKILSYGVSTKTHAPSAITRISTEQALVMVTRNPEYGADDGMIETARHHGAGVLIKKALVSGRLPAGENPVEACLRAALAGPLGSAVSSVVVGTTDVGHLTGNVEAMGRVVAQP